jgi:hypothetical protein
VVEDGRGTRAPPSALKPEDIFLRHSEAARGRVSVCGGSTKLPSDSLVQGAGYYSDPWVASVPANR